MENLVNKSLKSLKEFKVEIQTPSQAFQASLSVILQHVADFHIAFVDSISDHYKIDADEIMQIIREHPKMKEIASSGGSKERRATARTAHKERHRACEARLFKACVSCCAAPAELEAVAWVGSTPRHFT